MMSSASKCLCRVVRNKGLKYALLGGAVYANSTYRVLSHSLILSHSIVITKCIVIISSNYF